MDNFISLIKPGALDAWQKHNIPTSITMAQAILESGWGDSGLAQKAHNLFGIKWYPDCGYEAMSFPTQEYINGEWITINAPFRAYKSFEESIYDHTQLLLTERYQPVREASDYHNAAYALKACGYATAPDYPEALINIIEQYGLNYYDGEGFKMYKDYDQIADFAKADVEFCYTKELMLGDDKGNFNPKEPLTREQAAVLLARIYMIIKG